MAALDDLVSKAKELADTVGKATGELVDDSRVKLQELKLSSELKDAYERLGSVVYDNIKNNTEIDQIRENMEKLKASRSPSDAVERYCPQCGTTNGKEAVYCSRCGAPLSIVVPEPAPEPAPAPEPVPVPAEEE